MFIFAAVYKRMLSCLLLLLVLSTFTISPAYMNPINRAQDFDNKIHQIPKGKKTFWDSAIAKFAIKLKNEIGWMEPGRNQVTEDLSTAMPTEQYFPEEDFDNKIRQIPKGQREFWDSAFPKLAIKLKNEIGWMEPGRNRVTQDLTTSIPSADYLSETDNDDELTADWSGTTNRETNQTQPPTSTDGGQLMKTEESKIPTTPSPPELHRGSFLVPEATNSSYKILCNMLGKLLKHLEPIASKVSEIYLYIYSLDKTVRGVLFQLLFNYFCNLINKSSISHN